jgi:GH25 family lysozyme M1 (1,4-beta-N-acetylmuramidase)
MLNGIDISSYQDNLNLDNVTYDFVMVKATQGVTYVNPNCDTHVQEALAAGKKVAVYHYADGNGAIAEADYFIDNCEGYIGKAIFMLDWEGEGVEFVDWALQFMERVEERIGYKPVIYMSEYVENSYDWSRAVQGDYGLVLAKYADYEIDNNYDTSNAGRMPETKYWPFYMMWQWTSKGRLNGYAGDLDCDIFYGDASAWDAYAGVRPVQATPAPAPGPTPLPDSIPAPPAPGTVIQPGVPDDTIIHTPIPEPQIIKEETLLETLKSVLFKIALEAEDIAKRAGKTFIQTFLASILLVNQPLSRDGLVAILAAALSAAWNTAKAAKK